MASQVGGTLLWVAQWLACPGAFSLGCWLIALQQPRVLAALPNPKRWWLLGSSPASTALTLKDLAPKTTSQAFQLGELAEQLRSLPEDAGAAAAEPLLQRARAILGAPADLTRENVLSDLRDAVEESNRAQSRLNRLKGAFSVVNLAALLAIGGILVSIGPTIYQIASPLVDLIVSIFSEVLLPLLIQIWEVLSQFSEQIAWLLVYYIVAAAGRFPASEGANKQIAVLGAVLAPLAFSISTGAHPFPDTVDPDTPGFVAIIAIWALSYLAPLAVAYESRLLGFLAVAAGYWALGFYFAPIGQGYLVGFDSADDLVNCALASMWTLTAFFGVQASGVQSRWLEPFKTGASVFGGVVLGLSGLIWSAGLDPARNAVFFGGAVLTTFFGAYLNAAGLRNTGVTFFALWAIEKVWYLSLDVWGPYPLVLGTSVALYQATLFLRTRPDILASYFDLFVEQKAIGTEVTDEGKSE